MLTTRNTSGLLAYLLAAEEEMPRLLTNESRWNDKFINYEKPHVERLWTPWQDAHRLLLHRIHPCEPREAFLHHHGWPAAIRVKRGAYEMLVSFGATIPDCAPPMRIILTEGSCYVMDNINQVHSVRPLEENSLSTMMTGKPWGREETKGIIPVQRNLTVLEREQMFEDFREVYKV